MKRNRQVNTEPKPEPSYIDNSSGDEIPSNVKLTRGTNKTNIEINLKKREATDELPNQAFKKAKVNTDEFNQILNKIMQTNLTVTPASKIQEDIDKYILSASEEMAKLITTANAMQKQREVEELEKMNDQERMMRLERNKRFLNELNTFFEDERYDELPNAFKTVIEQQIKHILQDAIAEAYSLKNTEKNNTFLTNLKSLFNSIITFYTEITTTVVKKTPEVAAKIGSGIAGVAIIGAAASIPMGTTDNATLLMQLANYLSTSITTGVGLYFLRNAGINVENMLENLGKGATGCVSGITQLIDDGITGAYKTGITKLHELLNQQDVWDDSQSSIDISVTTASSTASTIITNIIDNEYDIINSPKPSDSQISDITTSCLGSQNSDIENNYDINNNYEVGTQDTLLDKNNVLGSTMLSETQLDIDGGRTRRRKYAKKNKNSKKITKKIKRSNKKKTKKNKKRYKKRGKGQHNRITKSR